jgi:6-phosphogluconolactonase
VGGSVTGLLGTGLVLQNNGGDDLAITANGSFSFGSALPSGANYAVTVKSQSKILTRVCTVSNGGGTLADGAVANVAVNCAAPAARFAYAADYGSATPCWPTPSMPAPAP